MPPPCNEYKASRGPGEVAEAQHQHAPSTTAAVNHFTSVCTAAVRSALCRRDYALLGFATLFLELMGEGRRGGRAPVHVCRLYKRLKSLKKDIQNIVTSSYE